MSTPKEGGYSVSKKSIQAMLDSPIAFHKIFAIVCKSALSGLFLSQAFYWTGKSSKENGWFYKTGIEWEEEIAMSRREIETARRDLRDLGLIEEDKKGVPCRVFYRVNMDVLMELIEQTSLAETSKLECAKPPSSDGGNEQTITENTQVNTTEITNNPSLSGFSLSGESNNKSKKHIRVLSKELPAWLPIDEWNGWLDMRKKMRKPATDIAKEDALAKLNQLRLEGESMVEVIRYAISRNWLSFWGIKSNGNGFHNSQQSRTNGSGATGHLLDHLPDADEIARRRKADDERLRKRREGMQV